MEGDPYSLIEGMAIAGVAIGATKGYIYVRSEYPYAEATMSEAIAQARDRGYLGVDILGSGKAFHLDVRMGAGSYVCGEETAMLESLEGKRGIVRAKPPLPALHGLYGWPTVINNVISFASVPRILADGAQAYHEFGTAAARDAAVPARGQHQAGRPRRPAVRRHAARAGVRLRRRHRIGTAGQGDPGRRPARRLRARIEMGRADRLRRYAAFGGDVGHGGVVVHSTIPSTSRARPLCDGVLRLESCGKCTPCRIGSMRGAEVIERS